MARMLNECPNCGSQWGPGSQEWQFQECDHCGWPADFDSFDNDPDDQDWGEEEEAGFYEPDDETLFDPTAHDPLAKKGIVESPKNLEDE